jgi:hypothetical protein
LASGRGLSTENAEFVLTNSELKSINQNMHVGGIFCNVAKAFDCVNHESLLTTLYFYCIHVPAENWFRSYLTDRRQKVEIKSSNNTQNFCSDWGRIKQVVVQGSILGPLLYIMYINGLPSIISTLSNP